MFLWYILTGILLSIIGAIPLGASNIAVITTSSKESLTKGMQIAHGAGTGEVILVFLALCYSQFITKIFESNFWIQLLFIVLFFTVGLLFIFSSRLNLNLKSSFTNKRKYSKIVTGILLSFANPPVLIYWIVAISITQKYFLSISKMSPMLLLILFFIGVYTGKVITLYIYGKWSRRGAQKQTRTNTKLYRLIGIVLIILSAVQGIRFMIS